MRTARFFSGRMHDQRRAVHGGHGPLAWRGTPWLAAVLLLLPYGAAHAGDTLEPFDPGFSDFEFYLNYGGLGKAEPERGLGAEGRVGVGITDWLSGYLILSGEANESLSEGAGAFALGLFATPLDTDHLDIDIGLDFTVGNLGNGVPHPAEHARASIEFVPFMEINVDTDPEMNGFGAWLWVEHAFGGRDDSRFDDLGNEIRDFTLTSGTALTLGAYYRFRERHEVNVTYDLAFDHTNPEGERSFDNGGAALGYNVCVLDNLELISEVRFDVPQGDEAFGVDFLLGFIATFPPEDD